MQFWGYSKVTGVENFDFAFQLHPIQKNKQTKATTTIYLMQLKMYKATGQNEVRMPKHAQRPLTAENKFTAPQHPPIAPAENHCSR